jgi:glucokinase
MNPDSAAPMTNTTSSSVTRRRGYLAVDVGGTKLAAGIVSLDGEILVRDRVPTPHREPWPSVARLVRRVQAAQPDVELLGCGVGCGGPMSPGGRSVSPLHIRGWKDFPLHDAIEELTGLTTTVDNDAKALALGEGWMGAAVGERDYLAMVVSTGVGGGIVLDGRVLEGRQGNAGHIGHVVVEPDGRPCACGGNGCLEAYISGPAVEAETGRSAHSAPAAIIERNGRLLGRALASVGALLDLRVAVVGGSVALGFGAPFFDVVRAELRDRGRLGFVAQMRVEPVAHGASAGLIGAAALARRAADG